MFTDKNNPAKDIHELCQYLKIDGQNTPYIYRGQVDDYEGPLVPSMYRQHISRFDKFIEKGDPLFDPSSKKIGNKFYGDYVANFQKYKNKMFESSTNVSRELLYYVYHKALKGIELLFSQQTSRILLSRFTSRLDLIRAILSRDEMQLFDLHKDRWMLSINNYDRRMIRNFGFYKPLGYILGTALAQQYGFSSEGLDATKDIEVACFFATHSSKDYYKKILEEGIGVVYRFPYKEVYAAQDGGFDYDFYSPYSLIDIDAIFKHLTCEFDNISNFYDSFKTFYLKRMMNGEADYNLLRLPNNSYQDSRVFRQKAVILLPDELREEDETSELSIIGTRLPRYQYIEDLSSRDGVKKYFFRHSKNNDLSLNREYLWPREDPILNLVIWIVGSICQRTFGRENHIILHRLDLIDGGYDPGEFLVCCMKIAMDNLMMLVSPNNTIILTTNILEN